MCRASAEFDEALAMPHCRKSTGVVVPGQIRRAAVAASVLLSVLEPSGAFFADSKVQSGNLVDVALHQGHNLSQRPHMMRREHDRDHPHHNHPHRHDDLHPSFDKENPHGILDQLESMVIEEFGGGQRSEHVQASYPANWTMRTAGTSVWACAWEGGDCCCKGSVRLGKHVDHGSEYWTEWIESEGWLSCEAAVIGEPNAAEEDKYCECHGYCPVFCNQPTYMPEHLNTTHYCAVEQASYSPGEYCKPVCEDGYYSSSDYIWCRTDRFGEHGYKWTPENFTCEGMPCAAPTWINNSHTPSCMQGSHIIHGSECSNACAEGYTPDVSVLTCSLGVLDPPDFQCIPQPCSAEVGMNPLNGHPEGPCKEGPLINSGEICTLQCTDGYRPTRNSLFCHLGTFSPAAFYCHEIPCAVPTTRHQAASPCKENWNTYTSSSIPSNATCTPQCEPGYHSTVENMSCHKGELEPSTYVCEEAPCDSPTISDASKPCKEGSQMEHDTACTTQCDAGFSPSVAALLCNRSNFIPPSFSCDPDPCVMPSARNAPPMPCQGLSSPTILSGSVCTPVCDDGYNASVLSLSCSKGVLTPKNFTCNGKGCGAPGSIPNTEAVSCKEGLQIPSGHGCTLNCAKGYTPSHTSPFFCSYGALHMPENIACVEASCQLPSDIQHVVAGACPGFTDWTLQSGRSCAPACQGDHIASEPTLSCTRGVLYPPTFQCRTGKTCNITTAIASNLPDSSISVCWEGDRVHHNRNCTTSCGSGSGFTPSVQSLKCDDGTLVPGSFDCVANAKLGTSARCMAPTNVEHAKVQPCEEGVVFGEGEVCTPRCHAHHRASESSLTCIAGSWFPTTFECELRPNLRESHAGTGEAHLSHHQNHHRHHSSGENNEEQHTGNYHTHHHNHHSSGENNQEEHTGNHHTHHHSHHSSGENNEEEHTGNHHTHDSHSEYDDEQRTGNHHTRQNHGRNDEPQYPGNYDTYQSYAANIDEHHTRNHHTHYSSGGSNEEEHTGNHFKTHRHAKHHHT